MAGEFERLAYEAALRGLDKQERVVEELRARTGVLVAASSLAASFLGQPAFRHAHPWGLAAAAVLAFVVSMGSGVVILVPRKSLRLTATVEGIYASLFEIRDDLAEVHRRLARELDRARVSNDAVIVGLSRTFYVAAAAFVVEVVFLSALLFGERIG